MNAFDDVSEARGPAPINQGESAIDVLLSGLGDLGTDSSKIKHFHVCLMPEDDLSEISIVFTDMADGTIDTDE